VRYEQNIKEEESGMLGCCPEETTDLPSGEQKRCWATVGKTEGCDLGGVRGGECPPSTASEAAS